MMSKARSIIWCGAVCLLTGLLHPSLPASAEVWDASAGFSTQQNPAGAWTYGFKPFDATGELRPYASCSNIGGFGLWQWSTEDGTVHHGWITRNANAAPFQAPWGVWWDALGIDAHPGEAGERPTIRWTAPYEGWVRVSVEVGGMDWADCDVQILANDAAVWNTALKGFAGTPGTNPPEGRSGANPEESASLDLRVAQGDTIDCTVGYGPDRNWTGDATAIRFTISAIDDPYGHIAGTVTAAAPDGRALEGVEVRTLTGGCCAVTDARGEYALQVEPGPYTLEFAKSGYSTVQSGPVVAAQGATQDVDISLLQTPAVWDAASDFASSTNPGCVWTYGYLRLNPPGSLRPYSASGTVGAPNLRGWFDASADRGTVSWNSNPTPYLSAGGLWWTGLGIGMVPGAGGECSAIRWTSPIDGWVSIRAELRGMSVNGTSSGGCVLVNDVLVWDCEIDGFAGIPGTWEGRFGSSPDAYHTLVARVGPADTVDLAVGWGNNGDSTNDGTGVTFTVTAVPDLTGTPASRIADVLENTVVTLTGKKAVSAGSTFTDGYFIEEPDRSRGIRVVGGAGLDLVAIGDSVTVWGIVLSDAEGPYIRADAVTRVPGTPLRPVGAANRTAATLNSLLVRSWGTITALDPLGTFFYIDDGSGLDDGTGHAGLRVDVSLVAAPLAVSMDALNVGDFVVVTGVATRSDGSPAIRPRMSADVQ